MQPLPGFRDFLPTECAIRNYIFAKWREVARRYGFVEWDGPVLEPTELYRKKSGAEIVDQLFNFTDKGEREVAMRPELTPTLARVVAAHEREFKKPLKWFSIGQFFRYEKQQRGRLREHYPAQLRHHRRSVAQRRYRTDRACDRCVARFRLYRERFRRSDQRSGILDGISARRRMCRKNNGRRFSKIIDKSGARTARENRRETRRTGGAGLQNSR